MRRILLITLAVSIAAFGTVPAADAASAKRCRSQATKANAKVIKKNRALLVARRGNGSEIGSAYYGCLFSKPRLYKISGRGTGDTEYYDKFRLSGSYVAYLHSNLEQAATESPSWIGLVDLKRRKRLYEFESFPGASTSSASRILVRPSGAVAWIGANGGPERVTRVVQTVLPNQETPAVVDRGTEIDPTWLRVVTGTPNTFSWLNAGTRKIARFGGPAIDGPGS